MKCLLCATDTPHIFFPFYNSFRNPTRWATLFPFTDEDTDGLQPKPKAIKADVGIQAANLGASVNRGRAETGLLCVQSEGSQSTRHSIRATFDK